MAKKLRKVFALLIVLAICAGHIAVPTVAAEVTETPIEGGTLTITVTEESTISDTGITTKEETTLKEWEQEIIDDETGSVTNIEGSETTIKTEQNDGPEYPMSEGETVKGSETTTKTTETTSETQSSEAPITNTTDNAFEYDPTADTDTGWVSNPGEVGKDTYSDAVISQDPGDVTLNVSQSDKKDTKTIMLDLEKAVEENIDLPKAGTTKETNADGSVTETYVEYIYGGENGKTVIGYTLTKTTSYTETREDEDYTRGETTTTSESKTNDPTTEEQNLFLLPVEPVGGTTVNEDGSTSVSTVEKILDDAGNHVGYKTITVTTHPDGTVTNASNSIYGTEVETSTKTTVTDTTTTETTELTKDKVTTTTHVKFQDAEGFELVWNGNSWEYAAELGNVKAGKDHGNVEITPLTPTSLVLNGKTYVVNRTDSTITPVGSHTSPEGYDYNYTGVRGEGSKYAVGTSNWYDSDAHMFQLKVGKDSFYVYCVDFATTATPNYNYTIENVADATYYGEEESKHIQAIGMYGYWGTTGTNSDGTPVSGSLAALKANLTAARKEAAKAGKSFPLTQKQINDMTEGEALTATQAAFWTYGNSGSTTIDKTQKTDKITGLYEWLISLEAPTTESTDIIEKDEFAQSASITVKDKATNSDGTTKTVGGKDVYNTDLSFTIDVTQSSLTGNLKVSIVQNGKTIKEVQLATADSNILGKVMAGGKEVGTSITFTDLELVEGVKFTINLDGTQELEEGVYIYTSEKINGKPSQTFVGLAQGEHTVDLAVDMKFTVTEPDVLVKDPGATPGQTRIETETERKTDIETVTTKTQDSETVTLTVEQTKREWESSWEKEYEYEYPVVPYNDDFGGDGDEDEIIIEDEDVPLAAAPQTGDISLLFAAISTISLGGLFFLNRKREDEE